MATTVTSATTLVPTNGTGRCIVTITDANGAVLDPDAISVTLNDSLGTLIDTFVYPTDARLVKASVGVYYFELGDIVPNTETNVSAMFILNWIVEITSTVELINHIQTAKVVSLAALSKLGDFRLLIDKSRKLVDTSNDCFLGYTDEQLLSYMEGGISQINAMQPGSIYWSVSTYPWETFPQLALEAGLLVGVMSQQLFAVDTDIPSYSDQGTSFVIQHQQALASFFNQISARLAVMIPAMKLNYVSAGSLYSQMGGSYRLNAVMDASPNGATFRNYTFRA
jgi:hypothetical protein